MSEIFACTFPATAFPVKVCEGGDQLPEILQSQEPCDPIEGETTTIIDPHCDDTVGINGGIISGMMFPPPVEEQDC